VDEAGGVSEGDGRGSAERRLALASVGLGALCIVAWVAGLAALYAGLDTDESGLAATVALLVIVVLAAASTIPARSAGTVVAVTSAVIYSGVWAYLRVGFDRMMPDAVLLVLTAVFFIAPLVTGVTVALVGARRLRST